MSGADEGRPAAAPEPPAAAEKKPPLRSRLRGWRRRHPIAAIALLIGLLVLIAAIAFFWWYLVSFETTDDAQIDGHISAISTRVVGTVTRVFVEDNQRVTAGEELLELDRRDYQVALDRAQAELAQAQANLQAEHPSVPITATTNTSQVSTATSEVLNARAAVAGAERESQSALARVRAARATSVKAQADRRRYEYLLQQHAAPTERYDQAMSTAKAAAAELASAQALARAAQKAVIQEQARLAQALSRAGAVRQNGPRQLSIQHATVDAKQAAVQAARATVERAELDLAYTRVAAPVAGVVGKRTVELGQRVQPGEQLLALVNLDDLWVTANFKETQLRHLEVGQPVSVHVDAIDRRLKGRIESFPGASGSMYSLLPPENATGNYVKVVQRLPVRIHLQPGQPGMERLRPGMSVEPRVDVR